MSYRGIVLISWGSSYASGIFDIVTPTGNVALPGGNMAGGWFEKLSARRRVNFDVYIFARESSGPRVLLQVSTRAPALGIFPPWSGVVRRFVPTFQWGDLPTNAP